MLGNLKISKKMWLLVAIPLLAIIIITIVSMQFVNSLNRDIKINMYDEAFTTQNNILNADRDMYQALLSIEHIILTQEENSDNSAEIESFRENVEQTLTRVSDAMNIMSANKERWDVVISKENENNVFGHYSKFQASFDNWVKISEAIIETGNIDPEWQKSFDSSRESINTIGELINTAAGDMIAQTEINKQRLVTSIIIMDAIIFILTIGLSLMIISSIVKSIKTLSKASQSLAIGDTNVDISRTKSKDEIGELMGDFIIMVENIKQQSIAVEQIASGNFDVEIPIRSDHDVLNKNIKNMNEKIKNMNEDINKIIKNIENGKFKMENDLEGFDGGWKEIVSGIYHIISSFVHYFDSLPIIVMTVDKEFNINFLNKTGTEMFGTDHNSVYGKKCHSYFKTDDCRTERCVCNKAMVNREASSGDNVSHAGEDPMYIYYSGIPMTDGQGNITGALEIVLNQTKIKLAQIVADKQAKYQEKEVNKLILNLDLLAQGNLDIKTSLADCDEDTKEIASSFEKINRSLEASTNEIKSYIDELSTILSNMADKDFTDSIEREYLGDFIQLKDSINNIIGALNDVLSEFNASAEQVETGADQVASSSQSLSQGSSEQASSIEEISSSINEVAEQTKENAVNANKANQLSIKSKEDALVGNSQMIDMLKAMNEIKESSKGISNIIKVIDEIAFQTNILALNAAVEAARAGEHGKGFAVVAEEVRNLAARSAKAAKETTGLIDNSIDKVEEGYKMANNTAQALGQIVNGVTNVVDIVAMIATASSEQTSAIQEVNQGIEQISQVIQVNTATAEESASASQEMAGQAQILKGMIQEYKLKNTTTKQLSTSMGRTRKLENPKRLKEDIEISLEDDSFGKY